MSWRLTANSIADHGSAGGSVCYPFPVDCVNALRRRFHALEQRTERPDDCVIALAKQRGEDVLADPFPPEVIAAVAARNRRSVQVDPMIVVAANYVISAFANPPSFEREASFQSVQVNAAGAFEIDCWVCHSRLLRRSPSQLFAYSWHVQKDNPGAQ
jgi:hypothetical protein